MRKILLIFLSVLCAAFMVGAMVACGDEEVPGPDDNPPDDGKTAYVVSVYSPGGGKLRGVTVNVYDDGLNRVGMETTDKTGSVSFRLEEGEYSVRLTTIPNGYFHQVANDYAFDKDSTELKIYLNSKIIDGSAPSNYVYSAGDVMYDFEVRTTKNTIFKLSEALETKKLVLINFWATWCGPCASEFPYMAEAYDQYKDDVAIIALSYEDANSAIAAYVTNNVPQSKFDWGYDSAGVSSHFSFTGIPVSIFIDRYGVFCRLHPGAISSTAEFTREFSYYCSDDYRPPEPDDDPEKPTIERPIPDVEPVESSVIEEAINAEDFTGTYRPETQTSDAKYSWPWLVGTDENGDKYVYNSNKGKQHYSFATLYLDYHAEPGDVLAFEYSADIENGNDFLYIFYDNGEVSSLTGYTDGWQNYYLYVAKEAGDYQVCFFYNTDELNEENSQVEDIVKIRNVRLTTVDEIAEKQQSRDIKYHCATGYNETANKWNHYVDVGLNEEDGYYRLLDGEGNPGGPIVLLNAIYESHWNNDSLYELAALGLLDFGAKGNYNDIVIQYARYASHSDYLNYVPVTEELKNALVQIASNYLPKGLAEHDPYAEEWLEMCVYFEHYGVGEAVKDPIKGVTPFSYYELHEYGDENTAPYTQENYLAGAENDELIKIDVTKALLPRGLYYKFAPEEDGVYEFKTYGDLTGNGTTCWIYEANDFLSHERDAATQLNEEIESGGYFTVYVPMEKGKEYFVMLDLFYQDGTQHGSFYIGIRNAGDEVKKLLKVTSNAYTTSDPETLTGGAFAAAKIIMIADRFMLDPIDGEPYIYDRGISGDIYLDFFGYNSLLGELSTGDAITLADVIEGKYKFMINVYDKNGNAILVTDENGNQLYDDNGDPVCEKKQLKFEGEALEYMQGLLEEAKRETDEHPLGMVKVDKALMEFLIEFTHSISDMREGVAGENEEPKYVTNEWLMFCCFYRTYTVNK